MCGPGQAAPASTPSTAGGSFADDALYAHHLDALSRLGDVLDDTAATALRPSSTSRAKKRRTDANGEEVPRTAKGKRLRYHTMEKVVGFVAAAGEPPEAELGRALLHALAAQTV